MTTALKIHSSDHVATLLEAAAAGERVEIGGAHVVARADIPKGHKIALRDIAAGEEVVKFGFSIGRATAPIEVGDHVHSHNLATGLSGTLDYRYDPHAEPRAPTSGGPTFLGYVREDGRVGTRNEIWIIPTVGCVGRTARSIAAAPDGAMPGKSTASTPSPTLMAARSSATISSPRAACSPRLPRTPMPAACC
jgi:altronate hydrolase